MAGQTALTGRQRRSLADDGYLLLPSVLAAATVYGLAGRLGQLVRTTVDEWDATPDMTWEEAGVVRLRLDLADPAFAELVRHPVLVSAAEAVIGPGCQVNGLSLRAPIPGSGQQGLHPTSTPDTGPAAPGRSWPRCGASRRSLPITGRCG